MPLKDYGVFAKTIEMCIVKFSIALHYYVVRFSRNYAGFKNFLKAAEPGIIGEIPLSIDSQQIIGGNVQALAKQIQSVDSRNAFARLVIGNALSRYVGSNS